jgi:hypothetical protein
MPNPPPRRTAAGHNAWAERQRSTLTQRQRTMLFMVDGQRGRDEVVALAVQAGADAACFDELVGLGLVEAAPAAEGADTSIMPSSLSLQGDSNWSSFEEEREVRVDRPLHEARALLLRAVRSEAPVAGALTLLKLKRAASRESLEALLDEVEQRLRKPHRQIIAAQTMRHVRHLLSLPISSRPSVG